MRKDIIFKSQGLNCSGWLYVPDAWKKGQKAPAIVMAHGLSCVKEQVLPEIAKQFASAGFFTLVFDYRFFGDSEGEPRSQIFPIEMVEDYRNAITWVSDQPEVDPGRVGIWGTSFSGGLVLYTGTFDRRVKAIVAQVPYVFNPDSQYAQEKEKWDSLGLFLLQDRVERYKTGAVKYIKIVAPEGELCVIPGKSAYEGMMALKEMGPNWRNQVTLESLEKIREFAPNSFVHLISPTALQLIPAENDELIPLDAVKATYEKAREPKGMSILPISHFEIYREPWLTKAAGLAIDWFKKYL